MIRYAFATEALISSLRTENVDVIDTTNIKTYVSMNSAKKHLVKDARLYDAVSEIWKLSEEGHQGKVLQRIRLVKK